MCVQFKQSFVQIRKGYFINVERLFPSTNIPWTHYIFISQIKICQQGIRIVLDPYKNFYIPTKVSHTYQVRTPVSLPKLTLPPSPQARWVSGNAVRTSLTRHTWGNYSWGSISLLGIQEHAKPHAPYTLPSENTTEAQLSQNFSQMYHFNR